MITIELGLSVNQLTIFSVWRDNNIILCNYIFLQTKIVSYIYLF